MDGDRAGSSSDDVRTVSLNDDEVNQLLIGLLYRILMDVIEDELKALVADKLQSPHVYHTLVAKMVLLVRSKLLTGMLLSEILAKITMQMMKSIQDEPRTAATLAADFATSKYGEFVKLALNLIPYWFPETAGIFTNPFLRHLSSLAIEMTFTVAANEILKRRDQGVVLGHDGDFDRIYKAFATFEEVKGVDGDSQQVIRGIILGFIMSITVFAVSDTPTQLWRGGKGGVVQQVWEKIEVKLDYFKIGLCIGIVATLPGVDIEEPFTSTELVVPERQGVPGIQTNQFYSSLSEYLSTGAALSFITVNVDVFSRFVNELSLHLHQGRTNPIQELLTYLGLPLSQRKGIYDKLPPQLYISLFLIESLQGQGATVNTHSEPIGVLSMVLLSGAAIVQGVQGAAVGAAVSAIWVMLASGVTGFLLNKLPNRVALVMQGRDHLHAFIENFSQRMGGGLTTGVGISTALIAAFGYFTKIEAIKLVAKNTYVLSSAFSGVVDQLVANLISRYTKSLVYPPNHLQRQVHSMFNELMLLDRDTKIGAVNTVRRMLEQFIAKQLIYEDTGTHLTISHTAHPRKVFATSLRPPAGSSALPQDSYEQMRQTISAATEGRPFPHQAAIEVYDFVLPNMPKLAHTLLLQLQEQDLQQQGLPSHSRERVIRTRQVSKQREANLDRLVSRSKRVVEIPRDIRVAEIKKRLDQQKEDYREDLQRVIDSADAIIAQTQAGRHAEARAAQNQEAAALPTAAPDRSTTELSNILSSLRENLRDLEESSEATPNDVRFIRPLKERIQTVEGLLQTNSGSGSS